MFFLVLLFGLTYQQQCQWIDEENNYYDYTSLDVPQAWHIADTQNGMGMFNMVYIFNFCNLDLSCHGIPVAVYEGLEVMGTITDNCDIVGLRYTKIVSHIADKPKEYGISISFNDNSQCIETVNENRPVQTEKPRTAIFNIVCSDKPEKQFRIVQGYGCIVTFEIYHPVGCAIKQSFFGQLFAIMKFVLIILILVHIIGFLYNKKVKGLSGRDAVPNIERLIMIKTLLVLGIQLSINFIKRKNHNGYSIV